MLTNTIDMHSPDRTVPLKLSTASGVDPGSADGHPSYRPDIDGLRAVAVISVVAYHAFPATIRGGFIGVDVFFVISGFLISMILIDQLARDRFSLLDFYARRVRRIFPALILVLGATFAVGWFSLLADQFQQLGRSLAAGAGFVANLVSWHEAGYFDTSADAKPLLHLWSLGIEEQFYLFWPVMLWAAWRSRIGVFACILAVLIASFAVNVWTVQTNTVADFYSPLSRFWELGIGAALASWTHDQRKATDERALLRSATSLCGAAFLVGGFATIRSSSAFPGWWAALPAIGTASLIAAGPGAWLNRQILARKPLVWIGLVSYPLYLWHWPILSFIRILAAERPTRAARGAAILLALLLAVGTYFFIERSVRRNAGARWLIPILLSAMLAVGIIGLTMVASDGIASRAAATSTIVNVGDVGHADFYRYPVGRFTPCEAVEVKTGVEAWDGVPRCWQSRPGPVDIVLIGDSHAEQLFVGLAEALPNINVAFWLRSSVPVVRNRAFEPVFDAVLSESRAKTVILSAWWTLRLGEIPGGMTEEALQRTIDPLVAAGKTVWLADDVPNFSFDPRLCKYAGTVLRSHRCADPVDFFGKQLAGYAGIFADLARRDPHVKALEIARYFCDTATCVMAGDHQLWYRDSDHLNIAGSQMLGRRIVADHPELGQSGR